MAEKFCIFCGEKPKKKNMEHVIPQWLIRLTGREGQDVFSLYPEYDKHMPFMQFKFPACTICNTKYAEMEGQVRPIMEKILAGQSVSGVEASLLMDWFDKIRVGLWLVNMFFDSKLRKEVSPHFFIDSRVGKTDRMLSIQKLKLGSDENKGIFFNGTRTPWFNYCPSAFTMVINDYYFFNASTNNLVSPRVGFPGITDVKLEDVESGALSSNFIKGRRKIANPVIQSFIPNKESITFYQPIYRDYYLMPEYPIDNYVLNHSYDSNVGLGGVFVQKGNAGNTKYLQQNEKIGTNLHPVPMPDLERDVLQFQNAVQSKNIISSPETSIGAKINTIMLNATQKQK